MNTTEGGRQKTEDGGQQAAAQQLTPQSHKALRWLTLEDEANRIRHWINTHQAGFRQYPPDNQVRVSVLIAQAQRVLLTLAKTAEAI